MLKLSTYLVAFPIFRQSRCTNSTLILFHESRFTFFEKEVSKQLENAYFVIEK
jgi:hypothetical protein